MMLATTYLQEHTENFISEAYAVKHLAELYYIKYNRYLLAVPHNLFSKLLKTAFQPINIRKPRQDQAIISGIPHTLRIQFMKSDAIKLQKRERAA